jgi:hypothetical protein
MRRSKSLSTRGGGISRRHIEILRLDDGGMINDSDCIIKRPESIADERYYGKAEPAGFVVYPDRKKREGG